MTFLNHYLKKSYFLGIYVYIFTALIVSDINDETNIVNKFCSY